MTTFYKDQVAQIISKQAVEYDAPWLQHFQVNFREPDHVFNLFPIEKNAVGHREIFNVQHPISIDVFEGGFVREGSSEFELEDFARGAATVSSLFGSAQAGVSMGLIRKQLEGMYQRTYDGLDPFPSLDSRLAPLYASCMSLILLGEETSIWHSMCSFVFGAMWMLGMSSDVDRGLKLIEDSMLFFSHVGTYNAI